MFVVALVYSSMLVEKLNDESLYGKTMNTHDVLGSQDPIWPSHCPNIPNRSDSLDTTVQQPNHFPCLVLLPTVTEVRQLF